MNQYPSQLLQQSFLLLSNGCERSALSLSVKKSSLIQNHSAELQGLFHSIRCEALFHFALGATKPREAMTPAGGPTVLCAQVRTGSGDSESQFRAPSSTLW